jgi:glutaredoxin-like protein DUF836
LNPTPTVTLYSRPSCHLCDQARIEILRLRDEGLAFDLHEVNIEEDHSLHGAYLERIPVVEISGAVVSELELDVAAVRAALDSILSRR